MKRLLPILLLAAATCFFTAPSATAEVSSNRPAIAKIAAKGKHKGKHHKGKHKKHKA